MDNQKVVNVATCVVSACEALAMLNQRRSVLLEVGIHHAEL